MELRLMQQLALMRVHAALHGGRGLRPTERTRAFSRCAHAMLTPCSRRAHAVPLLAPLAQAYYIYSINDQWTDHELSLDLSALPGVTPSTLAVVSAVANNTATGSSFHGEVITRAALGPRRTLAYAQPAGSVYMLTVPKVPTVQLAVVAAGDTTLRSGAARARAFGREGLLQVSTGTRSAEGSAVALLKFSTAAAVPGGLGKVVTAVLQLHLQGGGGNAKPQVLTVLGMKEAWGEESASWATTRTLRDPPAGGVASTLGNFVVWAGQAPPSVVGHVTAPPGASVSASAGAYLRLDVTDAVRRGVTSFAVVRLFRFDGSAGAGVAQAALPSDSIQGAHFFHSRECTAAAYRPTLILDYQGKASRPPPARPPPKRRPPPPQRKKAPPPRKSPPPPALLPPPPKSPKLRPPPSPPKRRPPPPP
jgi:hypothetical protein